MYWTKAGGYGVFQGGMDGSNPTNFPEVTGEADGIQIDFNTRRLYWAQYGQGLIQSSNLDGTDLVTIQERPAGPFGLALVGSRVYWGYWSSNGAIESSSVEPGSEIRVEITGRVVTRHFTVPLWNPPRNRTNDCEGIECSGVCVLTPSSYKCLPLL